MAEFFCNLSNAPVIVGIFQSLADALLLKIERHPAQFGIFLNAVIVRVGGGGLHRLKGSLVVEALYPFQYHVCQHGACVITYHAPSLAPVE